MNSTQYVQAAYQLSQQPWVKKAMEADHMVGLTNVAIFLICKEAQRIDQEKRYDSLTSNPAIKSAFVNSSWPSKQADSQIRELLANLGNMASSAKDQLQAAGNSAGGTISSIADQLKRYNYQQKYDELKNNPYVQKALMGAAIGAPAMGASALLSGEGLGGTLKNTLGGALAGGMLGGGYQALNEHVLPQFKGNGNLNAPPPAPQHAGESDNDNPAVRDFISQTFPGRDDDITLRSNAVPGLEGVDDVRLRSDELSDFLDNIGEDRWTSLNRPETSSDPLTMVNPAASDSLWWQPHNQLYGGNPLLTATGSVGTAGLPSAAVLANRYSDDLLDSVRSSRGHENIMDLNRLSQNAKLMFGDDEARNGLTETQRLNLPNTGASPVRGLARLLGNSDPQRLNEWANKGYDHTSFQPLLHDYLKSNTDGHLKDLGYDDIEPDQSWLKQQGAKPSPSGNLEAMPEHRRLFNQERLEKELSYNNDPTKFKKDLQHIYKPVGSRRLLPWLDNIARNAPGAQAADPGGWNNIRSYNPNVPQRMGMKGHGLLGLGSYLGMNYGVLPAITGMGPTQDDEVYNHVQDILKQPGGQDRYSQALDSVLSKRKQPAS